MEIANYTNVAGLSFVYDTMGRIINSGYGNPSSANNWEPGMSYGYDLAGQLISIHNNMNGRQINQQWDPAGRLARVYSPASGSTPEVDFVGGPLAGGISYSPAGAMKSATYGNGVTQNWSYNNRLQPCAELAGPGAGSSTFMNRQYYYASSHETLCGQAAGNNGNIWFLTDGNQTGLSQGFGYDAINRLTSAVRADNGYNMSYSIDSFGNSIPVDHVHTTPNYLIDPATNRLQLNAGQYVYDAVGNLLSSGQLGYGGHSFQYDLLNQMSSVDNGQTASYVYDALGQRTYKTTSNGWTGYLFHEGQVIAESRSDGTWTDYIYANGKKIARISPSETVVHLSGTVTNNTGGVSTSVPLAGINGLTIKPGDTLQMWQYTVAENGAAGGVWMSFTNNDYSTSGLHGSMSDTDGQPSNLDGVTGRWHLRTMDLSRFQNETVSSFDLLDERNGAMGQFDLYFADVSVRRADGTVYPLWAGVPAAATLPVVVNGPGKATAHVDGGLPAGVDSTLAGTHFYLADHLGTAQIELSGGGWPVWQGQFDPYGQELDKQATANNYKFTGHEHDSESGLDDFGARYYASANGRFTSPDWAAEAEPVPYAKLADPQTLNLYAYVENNPLRNIDPDGHLGLDSGAPGQCLGNASGSACATPAEIKASADKFGAKAQQQNGGEGSSSNVDKRNALADAAYGEAKNRSTNWAQGNGAPKCNVFVCVMLNKVGIGGPTYPGGNNPLVAQDWANPKFKVDNWRVLGPGEAPAAGDVAAYKESFSNATGHSGIVTGNENGVVRVVAAGSTSIYQTTAGSKYFGQGMVITYRRYTGP